MKRYKRKALAWFHKRLFSFFQGCFVIVHHAAALILIFYSSYCSFDTMNDRQNNGRKHIELHGAAVVGFCADGYEACKYMAFINVCMLLTYFSCVEFYNFCLTCFECRAISFATFFFATMLRAQRVNRLFLSFQLKLQSRYASFRWFNATSVSQWMWQHQVL